LRPELAESNGDWELAEGDPVLTPLRLESDPKGLTEAEDWLAALLPERPEEFDPLAKLPCEPELARETRPVPGSSESLADPELELLDPPKASFSRDAS